MLLPVVSVPVSLSFFLESPMALAYQGRPTAWRSKKNHRDGSTLMTGNSTHVHVFQAVDSRQNLDANQSN